MISRREFLRGRFSRNHAEDITVNGSASATKIAVIGPACMAYRENAVCRSCGDACEAAALRFSPRLGGAALPVVLSERCTGCGACQTVCPVGAIHLAPARPS